MTEHQREVVWQYVGYVDFQVGAGLKIEKFEDWYKRNYETNETNETKKGFETCFDRYIDIFLLTR
jgi:hypothetical protein